MLKNSLWKISAIILSVLVIHFCVIYFRPKHQLNLKNNNTEQMKLIIDTDAGGDDAVAIFLALAAKEVQVIAITCVYGNTDEINVENNVLKILTIAKQYDIPVYGGAKKPLIQNYTASDYFGKDGFGDFEFGKKIVGMIDRSKYASNAMIELSKKYPGDISILTLGPLTNVALAASLDPAFTQNINRFYVMGSVINELEKEPETEFNFSLDPESNSIFLNSPTKLKSVITPWDIVVKNNISKEWRTEVLGQLNSEVMQFLNKVEDKVIQRLTEWLPADSIAVATMIWPDLITDSLEAHMSSVIYGPYKGSVIIEQNNLNNETNNVEIVRDFNVTAFKNKLIQHLGEMNF